jgi:hypothetical protein
MVRQLLPADSQLTANVAGSAVINTAAETNAAALMLLRRETTPTCQRLIAEWDD